ncbi:hypothetical protein NE237_022597 [Protea cynaroides]|uniref:Amidase domain-containing protein n=1 Tax=Protea cynaroides TaxID=273540 RepID=A0A9Q0K5Z5_9MAGN|nr:hypothetical protein NE237_022597 [Protea cynaroides]
MENQKTHKASFFLSLFLILLSSSFVFLAHALSPAGTIDRTVKQQILASLPPEHEGTNPTTIPSSGSSQLFLISPTGKYAAFLLRRPTMVGAGGLGNDFCNIQVQEAGQSVWESDCASVSSGNTCSLVFDDRGLEIFDGSNSMWNTDADADNFLETLELVDSGDMRLRDKDGNLAWKASDKPKNNQNCGSIGSPGLAPETPPFAKPVENRSPFGQPAPTQGQQLQVPVEAPLPEAPEGQLSSDLVAVLRVSVQCHGFSIKEASVSEIQQAFRENKLTSRKLVELYLEEIEKLNPTLRAVIEVNPDALDQADKADLERSSIVRGDGRSSFSGLHGIPILIKDNIATKDKLNTTAGSYSLLGSVVPRDAGVVEKLRSSGAVILGKASLSEWCNFRSHSYITGWCARSGQGKNPYVLSDKVCASSTGSAIAVAANMVAVSLGTETDGSIICPASFNGVVGIKPTVGLTSRAGVIIISPRQDTIGPICRTVSDAVYVLDEIVGFDPRDAEATRDAEKYIPTDGYKQFLKADGLQGKRIGIVRKPFFNFPKGSSILGQTFEDHFNTLRQRGAILVDNLEIPNISSILDYSRSGEQMTMLAEFKLALNSYLSDLLTSPVRSLADVIAFNENHPDQERMKDIGQEKLLESEETTGINKEVRRAIENMERLSRDGFERLMMENQLDAMVTPRASAVTVLAIGGYPAISVPAGYESDGLPFGICFGGLRGSEPKLIEISYAFEQATKIRKPPSLRRIHVAHASVHSDL